MSSYYANSYIVNANACVKGFCDLDISIYFKSTSYSVINRGNNFEVILAFYVLVVCCRNEPNTHGTKYTFLHFKLLRLADHYMIHGYITLSLFLLYHKQDTSIINRSFFWLVLLLSGDKIQTKSLPESLLSDKIFTTMANIKPQ